MVVYIIEKLLSFKKIKNYKNSALDNIMLNRMEELIVAKEYGLNSRFKLKKSGEVVILEKIRKSRIIMKDAKQFHAQIQEIKKVFPDYMVKLRIGGPICSKSVAYFKENNIEIIE